MRARTGPAIGFAMVKAFGLGAFAMLAWAAVATADEVRKEKGLSRSGLFYALVDLAAHLSP